VFGKSTPPPTPKPAPPQQPQAAPAPAAAQSAPMSAPAHTPKPTGVIAGSSVIADDVAIVGQNITIVSQAKLQIDGEIQGNINGREVIVGPNGRVDGTITAESIEVRGEVAGALKAQRVTLQSTAKVEGDIHHKTLAISEGAKFDGGVRRPREDSELVPNLDVNALRASMAG